MEKIGEPVGGWRLERRKLLARDLLNTITTLPLCLISILEDPPILAFHRSIPRFFFFFFIICRCSFVTGIERDDRRQREAKRGKNLARGRKKEKWKNVSFYFIYDDNRWREREKKKTTNPRFIQRINVGRINRVTCSIGFPLDPGHRWRNDRRKTNEITPRSWSPQPIRG